MTLAASIISGAANIGNGTVNVTAESVNINALGCKPYRVDPTFNNSTKLQAALDAASQFGVNLTINFPGDIWRFATMLTLPRMTGLKLTGNGFGFPGATASYTTGGNGGPMSVLLFDGPSVGIRAEGQGTRFSGLHFQGYKATLFSSIAANPVSSYCGVGILIPDGPLGGLATGNLLFDGCSFACFQDHIQCGETSAGDNADQVAIHKCIAAYGARFLVANNRQCVANSADDIQWWNFTDAIFDYQAGGNLTVGTGTIIKSPAITAHPTFLRTNLVDYNVGKTVVGMLKLDNSVNGTGLKVLDMQAGGPLHLDIGLHIGNGITQTPLFKIRGSNDGSTRVCVRECMGMYERMFQTFETSAPPHIVLDGGSLRGSVNAANLLHTSSAGVAYLTKRSLSTFLGAKVTSGEFTYADGVGS